MPYFRGLSDEVSCVAIQHREDLTPQTTLKHKVSSPPPSSAPAPVGSDTPSSRNVRLPTHPCSPCPPPTGFCPSNRSTWVRRGCHRRQVAVEFGPPPPGALVCKKIERFSFADARTILCLHRRFWSVFCWSVGVLAFPVHHFIAILPCALEKKHCSIRFQTISPLIINTSFAKTPTLQIRHIRVHVHVLLPAHQ